MGVFKLVCTRNLTRLRNRLLSHQARQVKTRAQRITRAGKRCALPVSICGLALWQPDGSGDVWSQLPKGYRNGIIGGIMIGTAASLFMLTVGRVAGLGGLSATIFDEVITLGAKKTGPSQLAIIAGMLGYGSIATSMGLKERTNKPIRDHPAMLIASGILLGIGTRLGSGCTSGHGVVGIGRRSPRSIAAVSIFFSTAMLTCILAHEFVPQAYDDSTIENIVPLDCTLPLNQYAVPMFSLLLTGMALKRGTEKHRLPAVITAVGTGALFSHGLSLSGMTDPEKIRWFLDPVQRDWIDDGAPEFLVYAFDEKNVERVTSVSHGNATIIKQGEKNDNYDDGSVVISKKPKSLFNRNISVDMSMPFVMGCAAGTTLLTFPYILKRKTPLLSDEWHIPTNRVIDRRLVIGNIVFGVGWGLSGLCSGPAFVNATLEQYSAPVYLWLVSLCVGYAIHPRAARILRI